MMEFGPIFKALKKRKAFAALIILQVAITLTVMIIALLVTRATLKEWNLPSGLDHDNIVAVYPQIFEESLNLKQTVEDDLHKIKQIPGVQLITPATQIPFSAENLTDVFIEDTEKAQSFQTSVFNLDVNGVAVLGLQLKQGRHFEDTEVIYNDNGQNTQPAVVMISEQMAEALFAQENPVGRSIYLGKNQPPVEIIGVYSNFMNGERLNFVGQSYRSVIRPMVEYIQGVDPNYLIRVEPGQTEVLLEEIRGKLYQTQGRFIQGVEFLSRTQKRMYDGRGSRSLIMLAVSFVLLIITGLGISGLISFLVAQQKKQIGTRRALGAKKFQIIRYYLIENSMITGIGLLLGVILSLVFLIIMATQSNSQLIHVGWIITITLFIWLISLVSALHPAMRAAKVEPAIVTRGA
ncbi:ABC transporter permease [Aliikangiella coralliicola]|uniref:FtsX-like permease family protein n=1 Tax=Aliikangiella coralliicola TaxID=2592383 RepID=A0A545UGX6_9GAMM|nr:FtsX-like permease family protein [Aliikangiella coralliicola]TQV88721.1 FtsX-like permease family protein [Aliikangiella coralliicola]